MALKSLANTALAGLFALGVSASGALAQSAPAPDQMTELYGDWTVTCFLPQGAEQRICRMQQVLTLARTGQTLMSIFMRADLGEPLGRMTVIGPFGVDLSEGLTVGVDDEDVLSQGFRTCQADGCYVQIDIDSDLVDAMRGGNEASFSMGLLENEDPLSVTVSLTGFSAAWSRLEDLVAP